MGKSLKGKVVLITGSSIGIGREDAFKFAKEGCRVVITYYKDKKEAEETLNNCLNLGAEDGMVIRLNVVDIKSIEESVREVVDRFGEISVLINNAGVIAWKHLKDQTIEEIENQIRTNLEGLIKMTKIALPHIKNTIINIASGAGMHGYEDLTVYGATKWAVRGFTKSLAEELSKIKVYVVNPGMTKTRMTDFQGIDASKVAQVILNLAKGKYNLSSGSDVNIWDYV